MDLHFHGPDPTAAEQAAVDSVLGPPDSAWAGGGRNVKDEGHSPCWAATPPDRAATCFCPRFMPFSRGSAGSRPAPSTISAGD